MRKIDAAQRRRRAAEAGLGTGAKSSTRRWRASIGEAGYLFQADALFPWKTALDNVAIGLEIDGVAARRGAASARRPGSTSVGLGAFGNRYPHMLSGGQRKRVGLAQVLIRDPKILLMDEPFGPLDAQTRQIMGNLLLDLWSADRKAVLFVTHDLEEAIALADRVVIMSAGPARASSATGACRCRARATSSRSGWSGIFTRCIARSGACSKDEVMKGYAQSCGRVTQRLSWGMLARADMGEL